MTAFRIKDAAGLLGVSDDTVRRWIDSGQLASELDSSRRKVIRGEALAEFVAAGADRGPSWPHATDSSARNKLPGLVTRVTVDTVMAQVEMQCGPFRIVSLMSAEAVRELGLAPGSVAIASVKATTVVVDAPGTGQ